MVGMVVLAIFNGFPVNSLTSICCVSSSISMLLGAPPLRRVVVEAINNTNEGFQCERDERLVECKFVVTNGSLAPSYIKPMKYYLIFTCVKIHSQLHRSMRSSRST
jgi:hypothetical protein